MLQHTFCHIPRLGLKTESKLWESGVTTWDEYLACTDAPVRSPGRAWVEQHLGESRERLAAGDADYFANAMPSYQLWRLLPDFTESVAYLDIETTGLGPPDDSITSIAVWDGKAVHTYVQGENLDDFVDDIRAYKLLVSFNGRCFDVPFIEKWFGIELKTAHVDLRFVLKSAGITGGLKKCEKHFGLDRGCLDGVDGYYAVLLWKEWRQTKDRRFLETLVAYNIEDVLSLQTLAAVAFNRHVQDTPFAHLHHMPEPLPAPNPVQAHPEVLEIIRSKYLSRY